MVSEWLSSAKLMHLPSRVDDIPTTWFWIRLEDASEGVFDCPHSTPKLSDTGPLVVRSQDIITGVFRTEQAAHVSEETYQERISKATPSRGDLLYSREGTYFGIAAEVPAHT
jgi:type I restriction enzyme S subunit